MKKNDRWVTQRKDGDWQVKRPGAERASGVFDTQAEAWQKAREGAKRDGGEAFLTNRDHKIIQRNTYGKDPYPPKG